MEYQEHEQPKKIKKINWTSSKLKTCMAEDTGENEKRPTEWEKIFANYI